MVVFKNLKDFKVGERIRCKDGIENELYYDGEILYIHPTKGWLMIEVDKIVRCTGRHLDIRELHENQKHRESFFFSSCYRLDEDFFSSQEVITGTVSWPDYVPPLRRRRSRKRPDHFQGDPFGILQTLNNDLL